KLIVSVAVPPGTTWAVPRSTLPSRNVTVPAGLPAPAGPLTVAVSVTACPTTAGLTDVVTAVAVTCGVIGAFTVVVTAADVRCCPGGCGRGARPRGWRGRPRWRSWW